MARRESRNSMVFNTAMEDVRRQAGVEMEEELMTTATVVVHKEREFQGSERQQLLDENIHLQKKLSDSERLNRKLTADLHTAKQEIGRTEEEIGSLNNRLSALERAHNAAQDAWKELKNKLQMVMEVTCKRDEAHKVEVERTRTSLEELKVSSGVKGNEERWQNEVSQLKELLITKDKVLITANKKRRLCTDAYVLTLIQLNGSQAALNKSQQTCEALEDKMQTQLRESWEMRAQQWEMEKKDLEEMLLIKEMSWKYEEAQRQEEIQQLREQNIQLQLRLGKKQQKKRSWQS